MEYEFRGKRKDNGEWVIGSFIDHRDIMDISKHYYYIENLDGTDRDEVIPSTVGMYTGLKDKNGKKIYEGDIVKEVEFQPNTSFIKRFGFGRTHAIARDEDELQWVCRLNGDPDDIRELAFVSRKYCIEVIGNIHEGSE